MRSRLVRVGRSRGVRIPESLLARVGISDEVELRVEGGSLVISPVAEPRAGWAEAVAKYGPSRLVDLQEATRFDCTEWVW
jgi:antitoxin MazE